MTIGDQIEMQICVGMELRGTIHGFAVWIPDIGDSFPFNDTVLKVNARHWSHFGHDPILTLFCTDLKKEPGSP